MSERSNVVLVDMDGTIADFDKAAIASIPEWARVPRANFYVAEDYPEGVRRLITDTYNEPGFFENLEPMPGMHEGWQAMIDAGRDPRINSSPMLTNPTAIEGKIKWLDRVMVPEFGSRVVEDAVFDRDKYKYSGLAMIDDRPNMPRGPKNTDGPGEQNLADWEHVLFGWPHLPKVPMSTAAFRLLSWEDTDLLLSILEQIESRRASRIKFTTF